MDKGRGEERKGEVNGESSMDASAPPYVNSQPVGICCMTQGLKPGLCNNLEGMGREIQNGGDRGIPMADSC